MGNKLGSRKPSDVPVESSNGRKKRSSEPRRSKSTSGSALTSATSSSSPSDNHQSNNSKIISCPDISHGGAVPYRYDDDRTVDIKIYRSFSDVAHEGNDSDPRRRNRALLPGEPAPDIKVYRRSTGALLPQQGAFEVSSQTLPRSFGRSKSSVISTMPGNGTLPRELSGAAEHLLRQRHSTLGHSSSSLSRGSTRRLASTFSITSIGYKVSVDDFPNSATIRRKLRQFESSFVRSLTDIYSSLPEKTQMGLLAIAICPDRANHPVTLWQYMNSTEPIPFDLNSDDPRRQHLLTIPDYLYTSLAKLRNEDVTDPATWVARAREVMTSVAVEAANEISRVFEYQITLLGDGLPIELLARHGVECVFEYLKQAGRHFDRNSIVHGVIRGQSRKTGPKSPKVSVLIGEKELKWTVHEVFKLPGMRKDMFLVSNEIQVNSDQSPWKYYVAPAESDPLLYGYRGLVIDWDFASSAYRINGEDEASFSQEAEWNLEDFHRQYLPYRRLIGVQVVQDFCRQRDEALGNVNESPNRTSLANFVKKVQGESNSRDDIQPIYRPLDGTDSKVLPCLDRINLGGTDVNRVLMRNQSNSRSSYPPEQATSNTGSGRDIPSDELNCTDGMQTSEQSQKVDKRPVTITLSAVKNFFDADPGSPTRLSPTIDRTSKQDPRISGSPLLNGTDGTGSSISSAPENSPLSSADESRGVRGRNGNVEYKIETVTYHSADGGSGVHTVPEIARNTVRSDV